MPITPAQFRVNYSAFSDAAAYPNEFIQMFLTEAYNSMDPNRWGTELDFYAQLKAAHWISLFGAANKAGARGAMPGQVTGPVSSKGVGPASISYDISAVVMQGGDTWNGTIYGQQYWRKARLAGAGGMQLGIGCPAVVVGYFP
jgi:hypothetical protein